MSATYCVWSHFRRCGEVPKLQLRLLASQDPSEIVNAIQRQGGEVSSRQWETRVVRLEKGGKMVCSICVDGAAKETEQSLIGTYRVADKIEIINIGRTGKTR